MAQQMLKNYDLDARMSDRSFVGTGYKGNFGQFDFQSCPDYIWTLAEKYLGLTKGSLDNVLAIAVSAEATAMEKITDLGVKLIDANECRGIKAQPLNKWGHEAFRKCQIIGKDTFSTTDLTTMGFTADVRKYPVAPSAINRENKVTVPVYNESGTIVGYKEIANTVATGGGNYQNGLETVKSPVANPTSKTFTGSSISVALTTATSGADIYYTIDGTDPVTSSTRAKYSTALSITATTTVKAYATKVGMLPSSVITETYTK